MWSLSLSLSRFVSSYILDYLTLDVKSIIVIDYQSHIHIYVVSYSECKIEKIHNSFLMCHVLSYQNFKMNISDKLTLWLYSFFFSFIRFFSRNVQAREPLRCPRPLFHLIWFYSIFVTWINNNELQITKYQNNNNK